MQDVPNEWKINTSNQGKYQEFTHLFAKYGVQLVATHHDLKEILSDPVSVVTYKASQMEERVLVEDTVLDIEGQEVGVQVRWLLHHLPEMAGKKARWSVFLAYRAEKTVYIYRGVVQGTIVTPKGNKGFGFDPVFLPDDSPKTLAEAKPDEVNARAMAVEALMAGDLFDSRPVIETWDGPWQK